MALWVDERGQVQVYDKKVGKDLPPMNPINAAVVTNLNTVIVDGRESDVVERALKVVEDAGMSSISALMADVVLDADQRRDLARFIALHFGRTPTARRFNDDAATEVTKWLANMTSAFEEAHGIKIEGEPPELAFTTEDHVATMFDNADRSWPGLRARSWRLGQLADMPTADFPVTLVRDPTLNFRGVGLATAAEVHFATGPAAVLMMVKPHGGPDTRVALDADAALAVRQRMWLSADRFTYRRPGTAPPSGIDLNERRVWGIQR